MPLLSSRNVLRIETRFVKNNCDHWYTDNTPDNRGFPQCNYLHIQMILPCSNKSHADRNCLGLPCTRQNLQLKNHNPKLKILSPNISSNISDANLFIHNTLCVVYKLCWFCQKGAWSFPELRSREQWRKNWEQKHLKTLTAYRSLTISFVCFVCFLFFFFWENPLEKAAILQSPRFLVTTSSRGRRYAIQLSKSQIFALVG